MANKYLHLFENQTEYDANRSNSYEEPWVSYTIENNTVNYNINIGSEEWWITQPFGFEILSDGDLIIKYVSGNGSGSPTTTDFQYNKNVSESWTSIPVYNQWIDNKYTISVSKGDIIQFKATNFSAGSDGRNYLTFCDSTCSYNVCGDIKSLVNGSATSTIYLPSLFRPCDKLYSAKKLIIANSLTSSGMTNIGSLSYFFYNCINLQEGPKLLSRISSSRYCTSMFNGCSNLKEITCLTTDLVNGAASSSWVKNVNSSGNFIGDPTMTPYTGSASNRWIVGDNAVPEGWTYNGIDVAPQS